MQRFGFFEAGEMQKEIEEKLGVHIHLHDQCGGGLWFDLDEPNPEVMDYMIKYLKARDCKFKVSEDGTMISMK